MRALDSRVSLLQTSHHGIFAINFFCDISKVVKKTHLIRNHNEPQVQILELFALYLQRYDLRKLVFLQTPELHSKQVTWGKSS